MNLLLILLQADNAAPKASGGAGYMITTTLMVVAMCAMIVFVLRNRRTPPAERPRETEYEEETDIYERITPSVIDKSVEDALTRIHRLDSDMNARIDTRLRVLQQMLREADLKIEELKRLQYLSAYPGGAGQNPPAPPELKPASPSSSEKSTTSAPEMPEPSASPTTDAISDEREKLKERYSEIYRLKDENQSEYDIARQVNLTISEVRFILSLRNQ